MSREIKCEEEEKTWERGRMKWKRQEGERESGERNDERE